MTSSNALPEFAQPDDRRQSQRLRTLYRVARVRGRGDEGLARVCNLSDEGMMLKLGFQVLLGDEVHIDLTETFAVDGVVVWSNGPHCGIKLRTPIDSAAVLARICDEQRTGAIRPLRLPVDCKAVTASERGMMAVDVVDISQKGIKIRHAAGAFREGLPIKVTIPSGQVERRGVVRWANDDTAGIILTEPFTLDELGSLRDWAIRDGALRDGADRPTSSAPPLPAARAS